MTDVKVDDSSKEQNYACVRRLEASIPTWRAGGSSDAQLTRAVASLGAVFADANELVLVNRAAKLYPKAFYYGYTGAEKKQKSSADNSNIRGKFGDGLTSALLMLVKTGHTVKITSVGHTYSFEMKMDAVACQRCLAYSVTEASTSSSRM